ncbi:MAG: signal peptidase I [Planctomycetota bacterium]|jgi:signal peptidase I
MKRKKQRKDRPSPPKKEEAPGPPGRWARYWKSPQPRKDLLFLVVLVASVLLPNATVAATVVVPTGSMRDTIQEGERFVVWKLGHGVQNPLSPREKITIRNVPLARWKKIDRGEIVVFRPPKHTGSRVNFVKRVIALAGDTVEVKGDVGVFVNGAPLEEPYLFETPRYDMPRRTVPPGTVFVMGDNRNHSFDSHAWGDLNVDSIQGTLAFRYWPLHRVGFLGEEAETKNRLFLAGGLGLFTVFLALGLRRKMRSRRKKCTPEEAA